MSYAIRVLENALSESEYLLSRHENGPKKVKESIEKDIMDLKCAIIRENAPRNIEVTQKQAENIHKVAKYIGELPAFTSLSEKERLAALGRIAYTVKDDVNE